MDRPNDLGVWNPQHKPTMVDLAWGSQIELVPMSAAECIATAFADFDNHTRTGAVAPLRYVCQHRPVKISRNNRWFALLGLVAMVTGLMAVVLTAPVAKMDHAMMGHSASHGADQSGVTGCAHCPNCPHEGCPDLAGCLAKCFQPIFDMTKTAATFEPAVHTQVTMAAMPVLGGSLIPPLLRPPSV